MVLCTVAMERVLTNISDRTDSNPLSKMYMIQLDDSLCNAFMV